MKFLGILGRILAEGTKIITGLGPLFPQYSEKLPRVLDTLTRITDIIINIEAFGQVLGISGPDKLKASVPMVSQVILQSDMMTGKKIDNPVLFKQGVEKIASGMADVLNSLKADAISTTDIN